MSNIIKTSSLFAAVLFSANCIQAAPVAGEVTEGSLKGKTLTFASYGGIYQSGQMNALKTFAEQSGVRLLGDGPVELAKIAAQVKSGNITWDVVITPDFPAYVHCGTLFEKLDFSKIDTSHLPSPEQVGPCSVPGNNYGNILMYKTSRYKDNPPKNWQDFFDTKNFPGIRALDGNGDPVGGIIEQAIIAAGGSVNNMTTADIKLGLDKIRSLGTDTIFWKTGAESQQLAESGEVDMLMMWTGRAMTAIKNGAEFTPVWQDWLIAMDQLAIPVGVKDSEAAHVLINAYLGKNAQEIFSEETSYTPLHSQSKPKVDTLTASFMTHSEERLKQGYQQNIDFWVKHFDSAAQQWAELLTGY